MNPSLEMLADYISRLSADEIAQVLGRAVQLSKERDGWRTADDLRRGIGSADTDLWDSEDPG